ncbi:MAG: hypothetical protein ACXAC8_18785 [Candidatus Hodarchaeales archaeon]|jgi:hypothetical protein
MTEMNQVIIRNTPERGLDIVRATLGRNQIPDISPFLPEESEFDEVYLSKFQYLQDHTLLRFAFHDGTDQFGRKVIKTHSLIIENSFYNEKTAQYFISPLINGIMNSEDNTLIKPNDFEMIEPINVSSKFTELVLCKKHIQLTSHHKIDEYELIQTFGTIDRIIPPPLCPFFSFQTIISPKHEKTLKKRSLVFSPQKLSQSKEIEQIQSEKSEFASIIEISNSVNDLLRLRELQKGLILGVPERRLSLKLQMRFGIKKFSHIRENLDNYFSPHD